MHTLLAFPSEMLQRPMHLRLSPFDSLIGEQFAQDAKPRDLEEFKPLAVTVVAEFLRSPDMFQFDLMHAAVIRQLRGDPSQEALFELLQLVIDGNVKVGHPGCSDVRSRCGDRRMRHC